MLVKYKDVSVFETKDGSLIRELIHPAHHGSKNLSFAEAVVPAGGKTALHLHRQSEEIYHITRGQAMMTLGMKTFPVNQGDTILIPALTAHCLNNNATEDLHVICACSPGYRHDDTELLDD